MKEGKDGIMWTNDKTKSFEAQKGILIVNSNLDVPPL
jgi:hypothetical protein